MHELFLEMWQSLGGAHEVVPQVDFQESADLPSIFPVSDFAAAAVGTAGAAIAELIGTHFAEIPQVSISKRLASLWYGWSIRPEGWSMPPPWDPVSGDYEASDGWIRLHANAPHHREAALRVLRA